MRRTRSCPIFDVDENSRACSEEYLVVFVDYTECRCLRWLKRGFRHCFIAIQNGDRWIICDSLKNRIEFSIVELPPSFNLCEFYSNEGHTVVSVMGNNNIKTKLILPEILTCVAVVKRILGLRSFWTQTPWQLFSLLTSMKGSWNVVDPRVSG